jgi:hypothetical protein
MATERSRQIHHFLFPACSDNWISILRIGLGAEIVLFALSLRRDWGDLLGEPGSSLLGRAVSEALLSIQSAFIPRVGWLVAAGKSVGLSETASLSLIWASLLVGGVLLLLGLFSRTTAVATWFLHLCVVKSSTLLSYGMDNFTTIGLFYLMLSPLPDRWALDQMWRRGFSRNATFSGFFRRVLQLHLCLIYFFGGLTKSLGADWWNGANLWRALTRPPFNVIDPAILAGWKFLYPVCGSLICLLELAYPVLIWPRRTRPFILAGILAMHLGIALAMGMYLFGLIMIVLNLAAFGPGALWPEPNEPDNGLDLAARACENWSAGESDSSHTHVC